MYGVILEETDLDLWDCFGRDRSRPLAMFWKRRIYIYGIVLEETDLDFWDCSGSKNKSFFC